MNIPTDTDTTADTITLFECGPVKCAHDYSGEGAFLDGGWTAVCAKCGARAIDEAAWE